jgi:hypothetical protein
METHKKKRRHLHLCKLAVLAICVLAFVRCHDYLPDDYFQSSEEREWHDSNGRSASVYLKLAKQWYDEQMQGQEVFLKSAQGEDKQLFFTEPSWIYFKVSTKDNLTFVEVDLTDRIALDFVPADNAAEYEKTGDFKYIHSVTRLIIQTDKETGERIGFLMTIIPSVEYSAHLGSQISQNTYLKRENNLDGLIVYHNLSGEFVNGWEYEKGQIVSSLVEGIGKDVIAAIPATYEVKQKIATRSGDGEELPTVVITGSYNNGFSAAWWGWWQSYYNDYQADYYSNWTPQPLENNNGGYYYIPPSYQIPCVFLGVIKVDNNFIKKMLEYYKKADEELLEDGYIKRANGTLQLPTAKNARSLGYGNSYLQGKYTERIHTHPSAAGGAPYFSASDIDVFYKMYAGNHLDNVSSFRYIVASPDGILVLQISDETKFKAFAANYSLSENFTKLEIDLIDKIIAIGSPETIMQSFLKFLNDSNSGLSFIVGLIQNNDTTIDWNIKEITAEKMSNKNCK